MTLTTKDGTVYLLGESADEAEKFMLDRGAKKEWGCYRLEGEVRKFVFIENADRIRGLRAPLVYILPRGRSRADFDKIQPVLIATKARLCLYPG